MLGRERAGGFPGAHVGGLALLARVLAALAALGLGFGHEQATADFKDAPLGTNRADRPFDLGVADIDRDRDLDVYGTNHNRRAPLLINDGEGRLSEGLFETGLAQLPLFPGFENGVGPESFTRPGLYIFARSTDRIIFRRVGGNGEITGHIRAPEDFFVPRTNKRASVKYVRESDDRRYKRVRFKLRPGGELRVNPRFLEYPIDISTKGIPPRRIYLGPNEVNPPLRYVTLTYRDRHAMLWAQLGSDPRPDALIVRGGIKGAIAEVPDLLRDELLVAMERGYEQEATEAGLVKGTCRGRGVRPFDLGSDGDVDVLIECEDAGPELFEQTRAGSFIQRADLVEALDADDRGLRWVRMRRGGAPELMVIGAESFDFYRVSGKRAKLIESVDARSDGVVKSVAAGDYDGDGDEDLFASSPAGSTLLVHTERSYRRVRPETRGLPASGFTASWVDADNDGLLDLHDYQQGIFRQGQRQRFEATGQAQIGSPAESPTVARAVWFDRDGDGDRDVIAAEHFGKPRDESRYVALENRSRRKNHWLEVELEGDDEQAIDALGASVRIEAGPASRTARVGESNGSRYSWGHSRIYFGLGSQRRVRELTIRWSDGERAVLRDVKADRLLVLRRGSNKLVRLETRTAARSAGEALAPMTAALAGWSALPEN